MQSDVSAWLVASRNLFYLFLAAVAVGYIGKLLVIELFCQEVSYVELQLQVIAELLGEREVDGVARHLVAMRHS